MAAKAILMEQLKQILQLKRDGFSIKSIARTTGIARNTIKKYLARMDTDSTVKVSNKELAQSVYDNDTTELKGERHALLLEHFRYAESELNKTGVTRQLLWLEYKEQHADGYNYSQYCYHLNEFLRHKEVVMHLEHAAGEKIMIDFAGKKLSYVDSGSGEVIICQVFIGVLPHSGLIFCYAVHSQSTYDFITCINSMLKYFGGVTQTILCDNLKTAVTRPSRYEPVFTDMCYQLSEHYSTTFTATRPYKPRDKAMVERSVSIVYNHIYGPLRNQVSHSLPELNYGISRQLKKLNDKRYKGSAYSRQQLFETHGKIFPQATTCSTFYFEKMYPGYCTA